METRSVSIEVALFPTEPQKTQDFKGFYYHAKAARRKGRQVLCVLPPLRETIKSLDFAVFPAFEKERQEVVSSVFSVPLCFNLFSLASWSLTREPRFRRTREEKHRGTEITEGRSLFLRERLWWMHRE